MTLRNFTTGAAINRPQFPLTIDQVRHAAPSAFAVAPHESRSARYTYIPTSQIIEGMIREGFQPFKATQSRSRVPGKSDFTKHMIRFRHPDAGGALRVGDSVPEVVLINSHDGTSAYILSIGLLRLVCSNGLMVADSTVSSLHIHHKGNIVDQVIEGSFQLIGQADKALGKVEEWRGLQLTAGEQSAFAEAAHTLRFGDAEGKVETPITASQLLQPRRSEDRATGNWNAPKPDLWSTMNVVQENVIRGGLSARAPRRAGERRARLVTTREVKGIDQDARLNRALWQLAERMAELKKPQAA